MTMVPVVCYRCSDCNRIYEDKPTKCICERSVFIKGERFGPFIIIQTAGERELKVRCVLCDSICTIHETNIRRQTSCGCKPRHIDIIELTHEIIVYRCRKCSKVTTKRLPIVSYCCEDIADD